ncbi:hypothetical protein R5R35_005389 [Gryllus longicercus]|uniref:Winged helix-turn-helix domain-containing protein n=1 Tax=Gryllus longicercus TaxID=2509291 RepID=A0AAN9Z101_9ORTH
MDTPMKDHIVMTPKSKTSNSTTLAIERQSIPIESKPSDKMHVAGGDHRGIVINKEIVSKGDDVPAQLSLEFRVFLVNAQTGMHTQESRILQFWFIADLGEREQATVAQEFFRELVSPQEFPRDYVGFIKKVMKLLQHKYASILKVEVTLKQLEQGQVPPARPLSADESSLGVAPLLTAEKLLELIESAYPNPVLEEELAREHGWEQEAVAALLVELQTKGLVRAVEHGAFTRAGQADSQLQVVKQMPTMVSAKQPTIAIITAQYCEKLAVDTMIENKETFVRYTTVGPGATRQLAGGARGLRRFGESNVYTLGNMGAHRIVCTKLPTVGHTREAMTAAGNTTTRLLGTFQKVDFVFLVGVGGGVPHYTDYSKHVRLGDVVISYPVEGKKYTYVYCESAKSSPHGGFEFETKEYCPPNSGLQEIAAKLHMQATCNGGVTPWVTYMEDGVNQLKQTDAEHDFSQPSADTDKLYMAIGEHDLIEVAHPAPSEGMAKRLSGRPRLHLAPVASGRTIAREDQLRQHFSAHTGALAFDSEFDAVIESVLGNCRESFMCVRGVADYKDGTRRREWQPYASLAAAAVMKSIICCMDPPTDA